jgi:AcrR family transcriptional regulator
MRVIRTRKWLQDALLQLMKEKPFKEIQITEIADRAQVSRPTFYLHYQSKQELLLSHVDVVFDEFYSELSNAITVSKADRKWGSILMFQYWERYADTLRMVIEANIHNELRERLRKYVALVITQLPMEHGKVRVDKQSLDFIIDFVAGGAYMLLTQWIIQNRPRSAEQMGQLYYDLTTPAEALTFAP